MRAMLASTRPMSITAQGVPYSRAILAASGVVIETSGYASSSLRAQRSNPSRGVKKEWISSSQVLLAMTVEIFYGLCLLYLFAQHFELQPFVFGFGQFLLRLRQRIGGLVEFLPILLVEIGIVKEALLFCYFGL